MTFTDDNFASSNSEELWENVKSQIFQTFSVWDIILSKIQTHEPDDPLERLDSLFKEVEYILEMFQVEISTSCTISTKEESADGVNFIVPGKNLCKFLEIPQLTSRIYLTIKESNSGLLYQPVKNELFETLKIEPEEWDVDFSSNLPHQEEKCNDRDLKETQPLSFWKNGLLQVHKTKYNPTFPVSKVEFEQMKAGEMPKQCPNCNFQAKRIKDLVIHFFAELEGLDVSEIKETDEAEPKRSKVSKIKYKQKFPVSAAEFKQMKLSNIPKQCPNCNYKTKRIKDLVLHFDSKCEIKETNEKVPEYSTEYQPTFPVSEIEFEKMKAGEIPKRCPKCNNYQTLRLKDLVRHFNSTRDCSSFVLMNSSDFAIKVKNETTGDDMFRCAFPNCPDATKTWSLAIAVARHWETKHSDSTDKPVACDYCPKRFLISNTKNEHVRHKHPEKVGIEFRCSLCGKKYKSSKGLKWHMQSHEKHPGKHIKAESVSWGETEETEKKNINEYQPTFPVSEVEFEQMKAGEIPRQCPKCNKYSTLRMKDLVRHFLSKRDCNTFVKINSDFFTRVKDEANPNVTKYYKCAITSCTDTTLFYKHITLARHLERTHCDVIDLPVVCEYCPQRFLCNPTKGEHMRNRHTDIVGKKSQCSKCGKEFKDSSLLRKHERGHSKIKPFKCEFCDMKFHYNGSKLAHMRFTHRDECVSLGIKFRVYHCEHCGQEFKTKSQVKQHIESWHSDGQNPKYKCPICSKQLKQENSFDKHMANSHGVGERCKVCNKLYKTKNALDKHMKSVHDVY